MRFARFIAAAAAGALFLISYGSTSGKDSQDPPPKAESQDDFEKLLDQLGREGGVETASQELIRRREATLKRLESNIIDEILRKESPAVIDRCLRLLGELRAVEKASVVAANLDWRRRGTWPPSGGSGEMIKWLMYSPGTQALQLLGSSGTDAMFSHLARNEVSHEYRILARHHLATQQGHEGALETARRFHNKLNSPEERNRIEKFLRFMEAPR